MSVDCKFKIGDKVKLKPLDQIDLSLTLYRSCFNPEDYVSMVGEVSIFDSVTVYETVSGDAVSVSFTNGERYSVLVEDLVLVDEDTKLKEVDELTDKADGVKYDGGKNRMSLLPSGVLQEVLSVLEYGSKKYADNNWQKVPEARTRYYDAMHRHIDAWWSGEEVDSETGKSHLSHAICCAMFLMWFDGNKVD